MTDARCNTFKAFSIMRECIGKLCPIRCCSSETIWINALSTGPFGINKRTLVAKVDTSSCTLREANSLHHICQDRVTSMGFRIQKVIRINSLNKTARIGNCQAIILNRHADTPQHGIVPMTKGIDQLSIEEKTHFVCFRAMPVPLCYTFFHWQCIKV